jgi:uncharacterized membrane protein
VSATDLLRFLHVASAFWFVAGLLGRDIVLARARRSDDLRQVRGLLAASAPFERLMVIPGSFAVLALGLLTWWAQELPLWGQGTRWVTVSVLLFLTMVPLVPIVFLPRGRMFEAALARALELDRITPELATAFRDPVVAGARRYELVVVGAVLVLMVTKPF